MTDEKLKERAREAATEIRSSLVLTVSDYASGYTDKPQEDWINHAETIILRHFEAAILRAQEVDHLEKQLAEARAERDQALHHLGVEMAKNNSARGEGMREAYNHLWRIYNNESKTCVGTEYATWGSGLQRAVTILDGEIVRIERAAEAQKPSYQSQPTEWNADPLLPGYERRINTGGHLQTRPIEKEVPTSGPATGATSDRGFELTDIPRSEAEASAGVAQRCECGHTHYPEGQMSCVLLREA